MNHLREGTVTTAHSSRSVAFPPEPASPRVILWLGSAHALYCPPSPGLCPSHLSAARGPRAGSAPTGHSPSSHGRSMLGTPSWEDPTQAHAPVSEGQLQFLQELEYGRASSFTPSGFGGL